MKKNTKLWISLGTITSISAAIAIGVIYGVPNNNSSESVIENRQTYTTSLNSNFTNPTYNFDQSASFGTNTTAQQNRLNVNLVRTVTLSSAPSGQDEFNEQGFVQWPTISFYEFVYAGAIKLTLTNGTKDQVFYFNNDNSQYNASTPESLTASVNEIMSEAAKAGNFQWGTAEAPAVIPAFSSNINSINNPMFQTLMNLTSANNSKDSLDITNLSENLKNELVGFYTKSLQFSIKPGFLWVNHEGVPVIDTNTKKPYTIVAKDFWYSYLRTLLLNQPFRDSTQTEAEVFQPGTSNLEPIIGGSTNEIDESVIKTLNVSSRFLPSDNYPNGYLFGILNINNSINNGLLNEASALVTTLMPQFNSDITNGNTDNFIQSQTLTFNANENLANPTKGAEFYNFFVGEIANSNLFSAAPSQYIQNKFNSTPSGQPISYSIPATTFKETGLAKMTAIFEYGTNQNTTLFAGSYLPSVVNPSAGVIIWTWNPNYPNQPSLNNAMGLKPNNFINRIIVRYNPSTNSDIYTQNSLLQFLQGTLSTINYNDLNDSQKQEVSSKLRFTKSILNNTLLERTALVTAPSTGGISSSGASSYTFNNAYSKLVYGVSLKQLSNGTGNDSKTFNENFWTGFGLRFRSIIQSAINWYTYADVATSGTSSPWVSTFAPDSNIGGNNQSTSPYKSLRTGTKVIQGAEIENGKAVIKNLNANISTYANELMLLNSQGQEVNVSNVSKDQAEFFLNLNNLQNQFKSLIYNQAKEQMTELLNQFYQANPELAGQKIQWELVYGYVNTPTVPINEAFNGVVQAINGLNPNLDVSFSSSASVQGLTGKILNGFGTSQLYGWSYDYNGIGTAIDGSVIGNTIGMIPAFAAFANLKPSNPLTKTFPQFYQLSLALKQVVGNGKTNPEFLTNVPFDDWINLNNFQLNNLSQTLGNNYQQNFAIFFLHYQQTHTNSELIELTRELNTIKGNSMEIDSSSALVIPKGGVLIGYLIQPYLTNPIVPIGFLFDQDRRITNS